ncbi:MAG: hypothetical protein ACO20H_03645 [Bacteriovoracaceae bacterium]
MKKFGNYGCLALLIFFFVFDGEAKKFASQYCEFELPPNWECGLEGTEWVCQSLNKDRQKEAIIILAAKIRGEEDSLDSYLTYLKRTKTFKLPGGKTQVSEPKYSETKTINAHQWVDSLHLASEVPGFYTRYLATVKEDLGVAVTLSVSKDHYSSYQSMFDNIVGTLRVFRKKDFSTDKFALKKKDENLLDDTTFIPDTDQKFGIDAQKKKNSGGAGGENTMLYIILGAVAAGFVGMKAMGGKKKKKKKSGLKKKKKKTEE